MFALSGFSWARRGVTICPALLERLSDRALSERLYTIRVSQLIVNSQFCCEGKFSKLIINVKMSIQRSPVWNYFKKRTL